MPYNKNLENKIQKELDIITNEEDINKIINKYALTSIKNAEYKIFNKNNDNIKWQLITNQYIISCILNKTFKLEKYIIDILI